MQISLYVYLKTLGNYEIILSQKKKNYIRRLMNEFQEDKFMTRFAVLVVNVLANLDFWVLQIR